MRTIAPLRLPLLAALLALFAASPVRAQVGSTTDIILGKVTSPDGRGVEGARVEVTSAETGITRRKMTDAEGQYSVLFPDGGGSYRMRVTFIGFAPYTANVARQADEDRLVTNVRLTRNAQVLQAVTVRATNTRDNTQDRPTAGSTERNLTPAQLDRLPVDKGDLNTVATLSPGVVGTIATDSTPASFSVAGQPQNQNQITLDGLSFGAGSVPQEAVRSTRVITSTYDVSRGQFTGGQVASTTRGGTNNLQGVFTYALRDPELEFVDESSATFGQKYMQNSISFGVGGPLKEDEMFIFGAGSVSRRTNPLSSLLVANAQTLSRLGASQDSVNRFLTRLGTIGVAPTLPGIPADRLADQGSAIVRFDWSLAELHTLTLRGDWRGSLQDGTRISPFSVPSTGGELRTMGGGAMATLTSHVHGFINELRAYQSSDRQNTTPYLIAPDGRVTVASTLANGAGSVTSLQFGGNPSLPQETHSRLLEMTDELSWVSSDGSHRYKLGGLLNADRSTIGAIPNRYGTFFFNSLADFDANKPSAFTRTLSGNDRLAGSNNAALYVGDAWRQSPAFQATYGLRLEGTRFPRSPEYNPEVDALFGLRTDRGPSEVALSPRIGFTYFMGLPTSNPAPDSVRGGQRGGGGGPGGGPGGGNFGGFAQASWIFRGGIGQFRGRIPSGLVATAVEATGLAGGQSQLTCIGAAVPTPDWTSYLADPANIPTQCAAGGAPVPTGFGQRRNVTLFDDGFGAPKVWRTSFGAGRRFMERYQFSLDASFAYGIEQTGTRDINLDVSPKFTLMSEGGRPVYVPSATIVPATGASSSNASRLHPEYGSVSQLTSSLRSASAQVTVSLGGLTMQGITLNGSYTFLRSRDQQGGFGVSGGGGGFGGATTPGNPNAAEWGTSDLERRHSLLGFITVPVRPWFDLTGIGRLTAGQRYTPTVGGDVNGDGSRNDRAFVFEPAATRDSAIANGMSRLINATEGSSTQDCLANQLGNIATRNSCVAPWFPSLDIQMNFKPGGAGLDRRLTISLQLQNALVGVDQLLHGSENLRGWGQPSIPDRTLLYVRGFDPVAQAYKYQVNEHFGVPSGANSAFRVPFQVGLQGRFALGQDPSQQQIRQIFGGQNGVPPTREEYKSRMARLVPNPFLNVIAANDSLKLALTPEQKTTLKSLSDSLLPKVDQLTGEIADILMGAGRAPDPAVIFAKMSGKTAEARKIGERAITDLHATLTAEQWNKLPDSMKTMPAGRGFGGGGGGRDGRPQ